jgi:hypothetical protein
LLIIISAAEIEKSTPSVAVPLINSGTVTVLILVEFKVAVI